jgi:hypothetical protein
MKTKTRLRLAASIATLCLSACGGNGDSTDPRPVAPPVPAHAAATIALSSGNAPFIVANAQAITHAMRWWLARLAASLATVSPGQPQYGYLCGGAAQPASVETDFVDADHDGQYSAGDRIVTVSPNCDIEALGGGTTTLTALAGGPLEITDGELQVDHTLDNWSLGTYGWSQRLQGRFRMTTRAGGAVQVLGLGDVSLTLEGGQILLLRNFAVAYDRTERQLATLTRLQFDLEFQSGQDAGQQVQVDAEGRIQDNGGNMGPLPGTLLVSGTAGTRVRLAGAWHDGPRFITTIDTGTGQFVPAADVDDGTFYLAFRQ